MLFFCYYIETMAYTDEQTPLFKKRHSLAHVLLMAVKEHFPEALPTVGPVIETGFYYDIDFGGTKITQEDLKMLEKTMKKILTKNAVFIQETVDVARAQAAHQIQCRQFCLQMIEFQISTCLYGHIVFVRCGVVSRPTAVG